MNPTWIVSDCEPFRLLDRHPSEPAIVPGGGQSMARYAGSRAVIYWCFIPKYRKMALPPADTRYRVYPYPSHLEAITNSSFFETPVSCFLFPRLPRCSVE